MNKTLYCRASALIIALSLTSAPAWAQTTVPADSAEAQTGEIVVTAQKRNENLQNVSAAVTAVAGGSLKNLGVSKVDELQQIAPSVTINTSGITQSVNIRGIGISSGSPNAANGVATYVDGMFQPPIVTTTSFYDIADVEVFRGPQGTFVGSNATGGAIFINSQSPKLGSYGGYAQFGYGSYDRVSAEGALNVPISSTLAVRGAAYYVNRNSFYTNSANLVSKPGSLREYAGRVGVLWKPSSNFTALLKGEINEKSTGGAPWHPNVGTRYAPFDTGNPFILNFSDETRNDEYSVQATLKLDYETNGGVVIRSLSGYTRKRVYNTWDIDATNATSLPRSTQIQFVREREYTQEINIISPTNQAFKWVVGGYYQHNLINVSQQNFVNPTGTAPVNTTNVLVNPDKITTGVFGQVTIPFGEQFSVDVGGRYNTYKVVSVGSVALGNGTVVGDPGGAERDHAFTGKAALNWKPDANNLVYAFVARGYKSGGLQTTTLNFLPETVIDYEIGWKSSFLDRHIKTQIGGFYYDYKNFQLDGINQSNGLAAVFNIANATVKGFEGQIQGRFGGLSLDGGFAYVKSSLSAGARFIDTRAFALANPGVTNRAQCTAPGVPNPCIDYTPYLATGTSGPSLYSPEWSWNVSASYQFQAGDYTITPRVNYAYVGSQWAYIAYVAPRDLIPSHGLLSANLTLATDRFEITAYGTNLGNSIYVSGQTASNRFYGSPREYGARVKVNF